MRYIMLIKRCPFISGHPSLEPDLAGTCIARTAAQVDALALSFIRQAVSNGVVPCSPYTTLDDERLPAA